MLVPGIHIKSSGLLSALKNAYPGQSIGRATQLNWEAKKRMTDAGRRRALNQKLKNQPPAMPAPVQLPIPATPGITFPKPQVGAA